MRVAESPLLRSSEGIFDTAVQYIMENRTVFLITFFCFTLLSLVVINNFPPINKNLVLVDDIREINAVRNKGSDYPVLSFIGLVKQHGYSAEEHEVTTKDGYILKVHRITGNWENPKAAGKPVAFLQHGYIQSSDSFVLIGPDSDLAFLLVKAGYDVWLGNVRGNTYSRSHVDKSMASPDFWEFSIHEFGTIDVPAMIDYVLKETGQKDLTYYGFSMGTAMSYIMLSTRPEYNDKVNMVYSLAPVAFWNHGLRKITSTLYNNYDLTKKIWDYFGTYNIFPQSAFVAWIAENYCVPSGSLLQPICAYIAGTFLAFDRKQLNETALPAIFAHYPAGSSRYVHYHFKQNIQLKAFRPFDWGSDSKNKEMHGDLEILDYNLNNIKAPVSLWYGNEDDLLNKEDILDLAKTLPNATVNSVPYDSFNHADFFWARNVKSVLYDHIIKKIT